MVTWILAAGIACARGEDPRLHLPVGLPLSRAYALAEIGNIPRGARLAFDGLGRIAAIGGGSVVVLNDATWVDIAGKSTEWAPMMQFIREIDGTTYFTAQGSWGVVDHAADGRLQPRSIVPESAPGWSAITNFDQIIAAEHGVFFSGWNGVVYWDRDTGLHQFFAVPQVSRTFSVANRTFVSSITDGIQVIDPASGTVTRLDEAGLAGVVVEREATLADGRVLIATAARQLFIFDGSSLTPWQSQLGERVDGRVSDMVPLADGGVAIAIGGHGVYLLSERGDLLTSLASPGYHQAIGLLAREPGVLWVGTELGVEKVLYDLPVSVVDQRLGVPITWPQVLQWQGRTLIASNGHLYEQNPDAMSRSDTFRLVADQPENGVWGVAAVGDELLVANGYGVFARKPAGGFEPILRDIKVDRLVTVHPDVCYVIGAAEIAVLRRADGRWIECAERIPGVGYPALVHASARAAWIELGPNRAARVVLQDGRLSARVFDTFPWSGAPWIHVSVVGDLVVLGGPPKGQVFFDEARDAFAESPALLQLFTAAPHQIARLKRDEAGVFWASHEEGVFTARPGPDGFEFDTVSLDIIRDRVPLAWTPDSGDVWLSTGYTLYHVHPRSTTGRGAAALRPRLVSVFDDRSRREVFGAMHDVGAIPRLSYGQNSLTFRFFAGSYASLRAPEYRYRLNGRSISASAPDLTLPDLGEGSYVLEAQLVDTRGPVGDALAVAFAIEPPWYRTWYSLAAASLLAMTLLAWALRWSSRRAREHSLALEKLVHERTEELRTAMLRLEAETRHAATLAERNRLAGEIHDSLQQGLSGLILQLEATLKLPGVSRDVYTRLSVARNMVSFTRQEVQNAVWNLESPLLENQDLADALRKMAGWIGSGSPTIEIEVAGAPRPLSSSAKHHLLRIAQEAITNAVRHGAASTIAVVLEYGEDTVTLRVKDDGRGFVPAQVLTPEFGHFGLRGLRGRADKVNGELTIASEPGCGASVTIRVPIS